MIIKLGQENVRIGTDFPQTLDVRREEDGSIVAEFHDQTIQLRYKDGIYALFLIKYDDHEIISEYWQDAEIIWEKK